MNRVTRYLIDWPAGEQPPVERSGSSYAVSRVEADGVGNTPGLFCSVHVALERDISSGGTQLEIGVGRAILFEGQGADHVWLKLRSPAALEALVSALLELRANPHGAALLASISPSSDGDDNDDDDDDEPAEVTP